MKTFNKLKWLLLLPVGATILIFYIYFKNRWGKYIPTKKYFLYLFLLGITFFIGFVVFTLFFRLVNVMFLDNKLYEHLYLIFYIVFTLSYYLMVIPCYIFSKKFFVIMDEYNEKQIECNNK